MNFKDELKQEFGEDFFEPTPGSSGRPISNWVPICCCGHTIRGHAPSIGGTFKLKEPSTREVRGVTWTYRSSFDGCTGAMTARGQLNETAESDEATHTVTRVVAVTCPCTEFRPVAKVDRPNRFFNQRIPANLNDRSRHPMMVGLRALNTHLSKRKAALADPSWADAEFGRRFEWTDRQCAATGCTATDDVWPVFVTGDRLSELRCPAHRP